PKTDLPLHAQPPSTSPQERESRITARRQFPEVSSWQGSSSGDGFDPVLEFASGVEATAFLVQSIQSDPPFWLCSDMFAGKFVEAALDPHAKLEIIPVDGQDAPVSHDRTEHPVVDGDFDGSHGCLAVAGMALDDAS
ncbi:MAG: hypothetical protein FD153_1134, partial [Rhodospirillaceae bacterium]